MSFSRTQHSDDICGEAQTSNLSVHSLAHYQLSHCVLQNLVIFLLDKDLHGLDIENFIAVFHGKTETIMTSFEIIVVKMMLFYTRNRILCYSRFYERGDDLRSHFYFLDF